MSDKSAVDIARCPTCAQEMHPTDYIDRLRALVDRDLKKELAEKERELNAAYNAAESWLKSSEHNLQRATAAEAALATRHNAALDAAIAVCPSGYEKELIRTLKVAP